MARYVRPLVVHENIAVDSARVDLVQQRIDPNIAHWSELARLPRIGEVMAKRIVDYRREQQAVSQTNADATPVFKSLEDLRPIKGIGPKTLAGMEPYLKFPAYEPPQAR
jgi:DNA uptake protein ComE-like DNA-binding protein